MDYKKNKLYFAYKKKYDMYAIGLGAIGALIAIYMMTEGEMGAAFIGILLAVAGFGFFFLKDMIFGSDAEYDNRVVKGLDNIESKALDKLGLVQEEVQEAAPISFDGYRYTGATMARQGKDGFWRTNMYEYTILFFSENEVHIYTYRYNTTFDQHSEQTDVYFYRDIVSASTTSESANILNQNINYESFKLTTSGGTAVSVSIRNNDDAQRSINAMRSLLKQKKSS